MEERQIKSFQTFFFTLDSTYFLMQYFSLQKEPLYAEIRKTLKKAINYLKRKNPRIEHVHILIKELTIQLEEYKKLANGTDKKDQALKGFHLRDNINNEFINGTDILLENETDKKD